MIQDQLDINIISASMSKRNTYNEKLVINTFVWTLSTFIQESGITNVSTSNDQFDFGHLGVSGKIW